MLVIGRALMGLPTMCIFDEPSIGMSPVLVDQSFHVISQLRDEGITVLLIDHNVNKPRDRRSGKLCCRTDGWSWRTAVRNSSRARWWGRPISVHDHQLDWVTRCHPMDWARTSVEPGRAVDRTRRLASISRKNRSGERQPEVVTQQSHEPEEYEAGTRE